MRHTVCLSTIVMRRVPLVGELTEMMPHCPTCGYDVPVRELTNGETRSEWEWNGDREESA